MAKETYLQAVPLLRPRAPPGEREGGGAGVAPEISAKLHFRGGSAHLALGEHGAATAALLEAQKLQPHDSAIARKLKEARATQESKKQAERSRYSKMFS
jgi:hypothetical protein